MVGRIIGTTQEEIKEIMGALKLKKGSAPIKEKTIKNKQFQLGFFDSPLKSKNSVYSNGDWFVREEALDLIWKDLDSPAFEKDDYVKLCMSCEPYRTKVVSMEVFSYSQHRESLYVLPKDELFIHYFQLNFPFGKIKEKEIIERIEKNVPSGLKEKAEYYKYEADCLGYLKNCTNRKVNGLFTACRKHSTKEELEKICQNILQSGFGFIPLSKAVFSFRFWLGNEVIRPPLAMHEFMREHYDISELKCKVISTRHLEDYLINEKVWLEL